MSNKIGMGSDCIDGAIAGPIALELLEVLNKHQLTPIHMLAILVGLQKEIEKEYGLKVAAFQMIQKGDAQ